MKEKTSKNTSWNKFWRKYKLGISFVFGAITSALICYAVSFTLDGIFQIKPKLITIDSIASKMNLKIDSLRNDIHTYRDNALSLINNTRIDPSDGTDCYLGINDKVKDDFAQVSPDNRFNFATNDVVHVIFRNEMDGYVIAKEMHIKVVAGKPDSNADLYVNKKMLQMLGVVPKEFSKGIFRFKFKKGEQNK